MEQFYADMTNYLYRCSPPGDWARCFLETNPFVQMIVVTIGLFAVVSIAISVWRAAGQRTKRFPSTALALVITSFLWPPATLILIEASVRGLGSLPRLLSGQLMSLLFSVVVFNPIVILAGVPVLIVWHGDVRNSKKFPFPAIYIAFTLALALQYAMYWSAGMHQVTQRCGEY
jgi:hypothetical protein